MAYEESKKPERRHALRLDDRKSLILSGVEELESFEENEVVIQTVQGRLVVDGDGLHVGRLDLNNGELSIDGVIRSLIYEESVPGGSLWSRLFK